MTKNETRQILAIIGVYYPNYHPPNPELAVNAWHELLGDLNYNQISTALKIYARTDKTGFAPTPGQLLECIHVGGADRSPEEAWSMVSKALRNGIYGFREEYAKLPKDVQRAVGSAENLREWALLDNESVHSVIHSNFLRAMKKEADRAETMSKLPQDMRALIEDTTRKLTDEF